MPRFTGLNRRRLAASGAMTLAFTALTAGPLLAGCAATDGIAAYEGDPRGAPVLTDDQQDMIRSLIAEMTVEEKAGQMVQLTLAAVSAETVTPTNPTHRLDPEKVKAAVAEDAIGSILNNADNVLTPEQWRSAIGELQRVATEESRLGIPLIYGIDSVHGANYVTGGTIFPQNLTLAATFHPKLAHLAGEIGAAESRAIGATWNFAPVLDLGRAPAWSRFFETFGEDPLVAERMGVATIDGIQGYDLADEERMAATAKHFLGYSNPRTGRDRTPAYIADFELYDTYLPPFDAAFDEGVRTIMVNSGEINGVPVHADPVILTKLLREEMGFDGVVVTDWEDVLKLISWHRVAANEKEATKMAVMAGIDMAMTPYNTSFAKTLVELVNEGEIPESRLDESVRRILALKAELGLFEKTMPDEADMFEIGTEQSNAVSLDAARAGTTLLRNNDGVLPLAEGTRILVTGPAADTLPALHGAWTWSWQGQDEVFYPDTPTVYDALATRFGADLVTYVEGATFDESTSIDEAVDAAEQSDVIVLCLGEAPSVEKPGDIDDLTISLSQRNLARRLAETGKPIVLALITNRPRLIGAFEADMDAVLFAGHPGPHGSTALADIISGDYNPSGRLPFSYPAAPHGLLTYDHKFSESIPAGDHLPNGYNALFPFGAGLSYTTFEYNSLSVRVPFDFEDNPEAKIEVSVIVRNTGDRAGKHAVLLYARDEHASISPRMRRLKDFTKIYLEPGKSERVELAVPKEDLMVIDRHGKPVWEPGDFTFMIGELETTVRIPQGGAASFSGLE